jgi:hypothetical protein
MIVVYFAENNLRQHLRKKLTDGVIEPGFAALFLTGR